MTEVSQALFLKMLEILLPINRNQNDKKILWALRDSNPGPTDYESAALTAELRAPNRALNL